MNKKLILVSALAVFSLTASAFDIQTKISIKQPGNSAEVISLHAEGNELKAPQGKTLPLSISQQLTDDGDGKVLALTIRANATTYYNIAQGGAVVPYFEELELSRGSSVVANDQRL